MLGPKLQGVSLFEVIYQSRHSKFKSKNLLNVEHLCFYFTSSRWSAVSVNHSRPPESVMNQLQDGGGFVA